MSNPARLAYLENEVQTAPPQRLRLLLIEGAIRFARQACDAIEGGHGEEAADMLGRCRAVLVELLSGVRPDGSPLTRQVAGLYVYLIRRLTEADLKSDERQIAEVISLLEVERETWQQACERLSDASLPEGPRFSQPAEISAAGMKAILPAATPRGAGRPAPNMPAVSQFSVEG
jgi:flagellar protein FliS